MNESIYRPNPSVRAEYLRLDQLQLSPKYSYDGNILIDTSGVPRGQLLIDIPHYSLQAGILFSKLFCINTALLFSQQFEGAFTTSPDMSSISCRREQESAEGILFPEKFNVFHRNNYQFKHFSYQALYLIHQDFLDVDFLKKIEDSFRVLLHDVKHESVSTFRR